MNGCKRISRPGNPWREYWSCTLDTHEKQLGCAHFTERTSQTPLCAHNILDSDACTSMAARSAAREAACLSP